jgi:hypothetical protein
MSDVAALRTEFQEDDGAYEAVRDAWWDALLDEDRAFWCRQSGPYALIPEDPWTTYLRTWGDGTPREVFARLMRARIEGSNPEVRRG